MPQDSHRAIVAVFAVPGVAVDVLRPVRVHGLESISASSIFDVDLLYDPTALADPSTLLHQTAEAILVYADGTIARRFTGIVTRVRERARGAAGRVAITVTLESSLAMLRYTRDCKLFQDQKVDEIAKSVLVACGVPEDMQVWKLTGSHAKRDICTQFDESALDFVLRILAEDGIHFFPALVDDVPKIVFADDAAAHPKLDPVDVPFTGAGGIVGGEVVTQFTERAHAYPGKVTFRDHDFKRPSLDLEAKSTAKDGLAREHYDYPGRYVEPAEGARRAKQRAGAFVARGSLQKSHSRVPRMSAGHVFTLSAAPRPALSRDWLVVSVDHAWEEADGYQNELELLSTDVPYQPLWQGQKPIVPGPQLAWVTGPAGEEIHCDEFGRVKVQFVWDRYGKQDDKSSFWVRVGQMHSSGSVAIPRVQWEVLVAFEDGDPDKPYVLGRLYNAQKMPPASLPGAKTQSALGSFSTPGGGGLNEVRTDDGAGSETFAVSAQKDMNVHTANNKDEKVTTNETSQVNVNQTIQIGANQTVSVGSKSDVAVGGAQSWTVGASRTKTVSAAEAETINGSRTQTIGAGHTILTPAKSELGTQGSLTETVAASSIEVAAKDVSVTALGTTSVTIGAASIALAAADASITTLGARAETVGAASIKMTGGKREDTVGGVKAITVGGALIALAGAQLSLESKSTLRITVGGIALFNGAEIVLTVGGSSISIGGGGVALKASTIKLTSMGPLAELVPMVSDN